MDVVPAQAGTQCRTHGAFGWRPCLFAFLFKAGAGLPPARERREVDRAMKGPETPFPRHWRTYIVLKWCVIAGAVALALKYFGFW